MNKIYYIVRNEEGQVNSISASQQFEGQEFLAAESVEWRAHLLSEKKKECIGEIKAFARRKQREREYQASPEKVACDAGSLAIDGARDEAEVGRTFQQALAALE